MSCDRFQEGSFRGIKTVVVFHPLPPRHMVQDVESAMHRTFVNVPTGSPEKGLDDLTNHQVGDDVFVNLVKLIDICYL